MLSKNCLRAKILASHCAPTHPARLRFDSLSFVVVRLTQDAAQRYAALDHAKRVQAERHEKQMKVVNQQKDAAMVTVGGVYLCERGAIKKVHGAIRSASEVQPQARLVQGAAQEAAKVARRAVSAVSASRRPVLEAELARREDRPIWSLHGMSQSVSRASSELVAASVQVRQHNKAAHAYMPGM